VRYSRFKKHLRKKDMLQATKKRLKSAEKIYYEYKKQIRKYEKSGYCDCERYFDIDSGLLKVASTQSSE